MNSLLDDNGFKKLEKDYPFLARAREALGEKPSSLEQEPYVIIDIETTGLEPTLCEITELGAILLENGEVKDIFNTLVFPLAPIPPHIEQITGITNQMVVGYPGIKKALQDFLTFIGNRTLVAHNAEFDIGFLKHHLKMSLNYEMQNDCICTVRTARYLLPGLKNHKLHTVAHYFRIPTPTTHRAIGDCEITVQIWQKFLKILKKKKIFKKDELRKIGLVC